MNHQHQHHAESTTIGPAINGTFSTNHLMSMIMNMHGGFKEIIFFEFWSTHSTGDFIASCVGLFLVSLFYEGVKSLREHLNRRERRRNLERDQSYFQSIWRRAHIFQSILHMTQVSVSYVLMLVVMTYNSWIFASVVFGSGLGYFLFGPKREKVLDVNEHCH